MRVLAGGAEKGPIVSSAILVGSLGVLSLSVIGNYPLDLVVPAVLLVVCAAAWSQTLLRWDALLIFVLLVILFVPIKKYSLPGSLPIDLEPYRVAVAIVAACWVSSLLIDPRVRLRGTWFDGPIILVAVAAIMSVLVNPSRVNALGNNETLKALTFLGSYLVVLYMIVSVIRRRRQLDLLIAILVLGGVVIACLAVMEHRSQYNVFDHLSNWMPFLRRDDYASSVSLGRVRSAGPAQHPIALGALLITLLPLALYLAKRSRGLTRIAWSVAAAALLVGTVSANARTIVPILIGMTAVSLWLRPRETRRLWPALIPAVVVIHFAVPGMLGTLAHSFFPKGGLVEQQKGSTGTQGRVADWGPSLKEWAETPLFGQGYATRVTAGEAKNARILDNQWLKTLLETGMLGIAAWIWLFGRSIRRLGREARISGDDWLPVAIAAALGGYVLGMFFFDAFSFIQATFLLYFLLAFAAVTPVTLRKPAAF